MVKRLLEFDLFNHTIVIWSERRCGVLVRIPKTPLRDLIAFFAGGRSRSVVMHNYCFTSRERANHFRFLLKLPPQQEFGDTHF
jgi:hypothetical protein